MLLEKCLSKRVIIKNDDATLLTFNYYLSENTLQSIANSITLSQCWNGSYALKIREVNSLNKRFYSYGLSVLAFSGSEAAIDLVMIQTLELFRCKST